MGFSCTFLVLILLASPILFLLPSDGVDFLKDRIDNDMVPSDVRALAAGI